MKKEKSHTIDILFAVSAIAFSSLMYAETFNLSPKSKFATFAPSEYPRMLIYILIVLSGLVLVNAVFGLIRTGGEAVSLSRFFGVLKEKKGSVAIFALFLGYLFVMHFFGFVIATILFLIAAQWQLIGSRRKSFVKMAGIAMVASLTTYYIFKLILQVYLPSGALFI